MFFFFSLFLPGADLQINIEYARKLLNYSHTELFKRIWERQSPWIYLLAQKLCVIYWQERDSPHSFYLPVSSMFPGEVSQNAFSTTQFHPSWCLSFLSPNWKAPSPSIVKAEGRDTHHKHPCADTYPSSSMPQVTREVIRWRKGRMVRVWNAISCQTQSWPWQSLNPSEALFPHLTTKTLEKRYLLCLAHQADAG